MNKYRFARPRARRILVCNLINIHLLIFPFAAAARRSPPSPVGLPHFSRRARATHAAALSPSFPCRGRCITARKRRGARERMRVDGVGGRGPSNYFIRGIPVLFVRAFVLRLLTADRALRKPRFTRAAAPFPALVCISLTLASSDSLCTARMPGFSPRNAQTRELHFSLQRARREQERGQGGTGDGNAKGQLR